MSRVLVWMLFTIGSMSMAAQTAPQVAAPAGRRLTLSLGQAPVVQKGTVIGQNDAAFLVSLKKDQNLLVDLQSPSTSLYFNVLPAESPEALYASDRGGNGQQGDSGRSCGRRIPRRRVSVPQCRGAAPRCLSP